MIENKFYKDNRFYDGTHDKRVEAIIKLCKSDIQGKLLDAGTGSGEFSRNLKKIIPNISICGADISDFAKDDIVFDEFKTANFLKEIPYENDYFDVVISHQVIEHLSDPDVYLSEINRVLKVGGILILTTPNLLNWLNRLLTVFGKLPLSYELSYKHRVGYGVLTNLLPLGQPVGHIRTFNKNGLDELVELNKFKVIESYGLPMYYLPRDNSILKNVDFLFNYFPSLASHLMLVAKKVDLDE